MEKPGQHSAKVAHSLHAESIVIDAVCPLPKDEPAQSDRYRKGGATAIGVTAGSTGNARSAFEKLARWHRALAGSHDMELVRSVSDVERLKRDGKFGVYFHLQGTNPIEDNLDFIDLYKRLGVGVVQLTYNAKNRVGDGCEERTDCGLSRFGIRLVERLNDAKIIVDCSHTGERTSLDAIEVSKAPVVLSHSNLKRVHSSPRNVSDGLAKAIAATGGVIGVVGFAPMISDSPTPSLDAFIAHIDGLAELVGIDHVGLGIDYYRYQAGIATDAEALQSYKEYVAAGSWGDAYPPPPHHWPTGIETPEKLPKLTERLLERGFKEEDVKKILGKNWLRVMRKVWR